MSASVKHMAIKTAAAAAVATGALDVDKPNRKWHIDRLRCISCGACVEACPKKCLQLTGNHGIPVATRQWETF